jgi:hypothetical protein
MDIKKLIDEIIKSGGASLDSNYNIIDIKKGYSVSILGYEKTFNINNLNYNDIIKDLKSKQELIKDKKGYYIGFWIDDGLLYVDISKTITNYKQAKLFAINNKQKAIFNNKTKKTIELVNYYYILYSYNNISNDIQYMAEFKEKKDIYNYLNKKYNYSNKYITHNITTNLNNIKILFDNMVIFKDKEYLYESI